jgi:hypothetical protein
MTLSVNSTRLSSQVREFSSRIAWHKATSCDLELYRNLLDIELDKIVIDTDVLRCSDTMCNRHKLYIMHLYKDIIEALTVASDVLPWTGLSCKNGMKKTVTGWKEHVEPSRVESLYWHECWLQAGKPRSGVIAENMCIAREQNITKLLDKCREKRIIW